MSQTASGGRRRFNRVVCAGVAATLAFAGLTAVSSPPAAAEVLLAETFKNASTTPGDWTAPSPKGSHSPCLTAADKKPPAGSLNWCNAVRDAKVKADPVGSGAFQITDNSKDDAGGLILEKNLSAKKGLHIEFDQFQYNTTTAKGADGISFSLIDGAVTDPTVGDSGGWLGYRNLKGALIGVGFDQYGNFSEKRHWGTTAQPDKGPGAKPNSIVVRGSQSTNYQYVTGVQLDPAKQPLAVDKAKSREEARRTVNVDVSVTGFMSVYVDFNDGKGRQKLLKDVNLNKIEGQAELPDKIKLGFAASTGSSTNYHEIQNFKVVELDPDLNTTVTPKGTFKAGGTGAFTVDVANGPSDGPTDGPITTSFTVPEGLTVESAAGDGWDCKVDGQKVTCTRPGAGAQSLQPGDKAPPIEVKVKIPANAPDKVTLQATTAVKNEFRPADNTSKPVEVPIEAAAPDIAVVTEPDGPFQAGGTGSTTTTVTNDKTAGPTTGPTTAVITAPEGTTIATSSGDGWTCKISDDKKTATCTTDKPIKPGESAAPIKTTYDVPSTTTGPVTVPPTKVTTPGETNTGNNTSPTKPVDVKPGAPDISVVTNPDAPFQAGGTGSTTTTVSNDKNAGPTTGPTTAVITAPEGTTIATSSGDGWTCKISDDKKTATCTTDKPIKPGESAAPIKTTYNVPSTTTGPVTVPPTKVTTPGETDTGNNTSPTKPAEVKPAPPNLAVTIDGTGNFVPGGNGTLTATVSNNKDAGPTNYTVTVKIPIPAGLTVDKVAGEGWTCTTAADAVTCTRPGTGADALKPGASYPPVTVSTVGKPDLKAPVTATATVDTKGDSDPSDNTAKPVSLPKPGVQVGMTITPNPYENGKKLTYTITVTNTGPNAATADLKGTVAQVWKDVPWKCTASAGSKCPATAGKGNIDTAITIAAGGSVVFTADCLLPAGVKVPLSGSATVTATGDANCAKGCTVTATSKPAGGGTTPTPDPTPTPTDPIPDSSSTLEQLLQAKIDFVNKIIQGGKAPNLADLDQLIHDKLEALAGSGPVSTVIKAKIALLKKVLATKHALFPIGISPVEKLIQAKIAILEKLV